MMTVSLPSLGQAGLLTSVNNLPLDSPAAGIGVVAIISIYNANGLLATDPVISSGRSELPMLPVRQKSGPSENPARPQLALTRR
jgi:hypothetical protein